MREKTLYEKVANEISHLIDSGTFSPGDRIPSVRSLNRQMRVSIATVMEAYRLLEDRGLIECRPQSGYYVLSTTTHRHAEIELSNPSLKPAKVSVSDLVMMILKDSGNPKLVQLGAAVPNPELLPVDRINRAMAAVTRRHRIKNISYEFAAGYDGFRTQIARRALTAGYTIAPDDIIITSGCQEAIILALKVICRPGDTVAIESPTYYNFLQAIEMLGLKALELPTHPRDGISIDALQYAIEHNRISACLCITNFNNPLGSCMPDERKKELVELLASHDIPLIEDDIYGDVSFSVQRPKAAKAFDKKDNVILCSSFSKTIAPGYRIGWTAPGRFRREIERMKSVTNLAAATPQQMALAEFLANGGYDHHLRKIRRLYARHVHLMSESVLRHFPEGTKISRPAGGYVLWLELPQEIDCLELYEKALKKGISFAPGPIFSSRQKYRNFLRLNAATWSDAIQEAIRTLGSLALRKERLRR
ncbi:MAG: PLP-dependent aminotransferase family protein [Nitrospirae bacterium]|nr:PLP-dependent aminotransferase family protein [Nitrospirota bacterium]